MSIQDLDSKGRIVIPKKEREKMGIKHKVLVVNAGDHLKLIPIPERPLNALEGAINSTRDFDELSKSAERLAKKEAGRRS